MWRGVGWRRALIGGALILRAHVVEFDFSSYLLLSSQELGDTKSMNVAYEPSSKPLHNSAKWLFLKLELIADQVGVAGASGGRRAGHAGFGPWIRTRRLSVDSDQ